jgi:isopenicillin N synthase-like dioxygenase
MSTSTAVPVVDFASFLNGDEIEKAKVAGELDKAFRNVGFVYLRNHGVKMERVEECFKWVGDFVLQFHRTSISSQMMSFASILRTSFLDSLFRV